MKFEKIFSTDGIITGISSICLIIENCSNLIFLNKKYPDDKAIPRKFSSNEEELLLDFEMYLESLNHELEYPIMRDIIDSNSFY